MEVSKHVHHDYNYTQYSLPHISNIWEGLFIKINSNQNNSNIYIGNIYRPPKGIFKIISMKYL